MFDTPARERMYWSTLGFVRSLGHTCPPITNTLGVEKTSSFAARIAAIGSLVEVSQRFAPESAEVFEP